MFKRIALALALSLVLTLSFAGTRALLGVKTTLAAHARIAHVSMVTRHGTYVFQPRILHIKAGTTVIWTNLTPAAHTVTEVHQKWTSAGLLEHAIYRRTFRQVGTFRYICAFHGFMTGSVVVSR